MAKWPSVPAVFGWLSLDRRGRWLLRGEPIANPAANRFIARNYQHDELGRWFFQNGPQRVFVELAHSPWVIAIDGASRLRTHTGMSVSKLRSVWIDHGYDLVLDTEHGVGLADDRDLDVLTGHFLGPGGAPVDDTALERILAALARAEPVGELRWRYGALEAPVGFLGDDEWPSRFGFVRRPRPRQEKGTHCFFPEEQ